MKTILIAIPTNKYIEPETMKSVYDLVIPEGYRTEFQFFYGYQIDQIRNLIADWGKKYDYLFCVDSDIVLPIDTLSKLISADLPIVSGIYIQRKPGETILEAYGNNNSGGHVNIPIDLIRKAPFDIIQVSAVGMGCCLIKSEVLQRMNYPHFHYASAVNHENTVSEDIYFCDKAKRLGYSTFIDRTILCDHIGQTKFQVPMIAQGLEAIANQDLLSENHRSYLHKLSYQIKPSVIYDIGASLGHWTRHAMKAFPESKFILFDASNCTRETIGKLGHDHFIGVLSAEDDDQALFYENPDNPGGNSYYKETTGEYDSIEGELRQTWTLDTVVNFNEWPLPDLIKMDIQGAELDVIKGSPICFAHAKDVILEAQHKEYNAGAPHIEEVDAYMQSIGFTLKGVIDKTAVDGDYHYTRSIKST